MKKKYLIVGIIILLVCGGFGVLRYQMLHGTYDLNEILVAPAPDLPIHTPKEAAAYLEKSNLIDRDSLTKAEHEAKFINGWNVFADKHGALWKVTIRSRGVLPSFQCVYTFTDKGESVAENYATQPCQWMK